MHTAHRVAGVFLVLVTIAQGAFGQSTNPEVTLTASPTSPAPGGLVTFTLRAFNRGATTMKDVLVGIEYGPEPQQVVQAIGPAGVTPTFVPVCYPEECLLPYMGFLLPTLAPGGSTSLALVFKALGPPGEKLEVSGFARLPPPPNTCCRHGGVSASATVAGSGSLPTKPSGLASLGVMTVGPVSFPPTGLVWDELRGNYLMTGLRRRRLFLPPFNQMDDVALTSLTASGLSASDVHFEPVPGDIEFGPRVAYSSDITLGGDRGGVLLALSDYAGNVLTQMVSTGTHMGTPLVPLGSGRSPRVAYSKTSRVFMVAWEQNRRVVFRLVDLNGEPIGPVQDVAEMVSLYGIIGDVTWNPVANEFGLAFARYDAHRPLPLTSVDFVRIRPDGTVLSRTEVAPTNFARTMVVAAHPGTGEYRVLWTDSATGTGFGADLSATGRLISRGLGAAGVSALAYNEVSQTFLASADTADRLVELNQYGSPMSVPRQSTISVYAIAAQPDAREWLALGINNSQQFVSERLLTNSFAGGSNVRFGGCATPDPFSSLGGGACYDGAWLPPGMAVPGVSAPIVECTTPDPFVARGGGTCVNGEWLPPADPPPGGSGGCATSDPFVSLGGGECRSGGWVPRGFPGTAPPETPPLQCTTPDPFVSIGGGICRESGWIPRGMSLSSRQP